MTKKMVVIITKPQGTLFIPNILWDGPLLDCCYLVLTNCYATFTNNMA